jgi:membrane-associated protease RseP (regulator of RpoE activity)
MKDGYLTIGRWRGVDVRVHWTTPIGAVCMTARPFSPAAWLAIVVVILVHELGHAAVVRWCGARVHAIDVHAIGGTCRWSGRVSGLQRSWIAWGGVGAQVLLAVATIVVLPYLGRPETSGRALMDVAYVFTASNLLIALLNLIPVAPLDGVEAWRIVRAIRGPKRPRRATEVDDRIPRWMMDRGLREQLDRVLAASDDDPPPRRPDAERIEKDTATSDRRKR